MQTEPPFRTFILIEENTKQWVNLCASLNDLNCPDSLVFVLLPGPSLPLFWAWEKYGSREGEWPAVWCCIHSTPSVGPCTDIPATQTFCTSGAGTHLPGNTAASGKECKMQHAERIRSGHVTGWAEEIILILLRHPRLHPGATFRINRLKHCDVCNENSQYIFKNS